MKIKIIYIILIILLLVSAEACGTVKTVKTHITEEESSLSSKQVTGQNSTDQITSNQTESVQVINKQYRKAGIEADYPTFVSGGNEEELKKWNQIIENDFDKILDIYSFNPIPDLTPVPVDRIPVILRIKYKIERNDKDYVSIIYTAAFNSPTSAHPTDLVYTTNINKADSTRIKLSDIVVLNKDFVVGFRTWSYIPIEEGNEELNQAVEDYFNNLTDKDLLMGFQAADIIGLGNLWGIYTYLTPDRLGISFGVPNYIGDHVEFEREYSEFSEFLKPEFNK